LEAIAKQEVTFLPTPNYEVQLQPASIDLRLGPEFYIYRLHRNYDERIIDTRERNIEDFMRPVNLEEGERFCLDPGSFALATTVECINLGPKLVGRVDGRSSYGRLGIMVHSTAGYIDPGFEGQITLELTNVGQYPVALHPGDRICQVSLHRMERACTAPYGVKRNSKYQGQRGATLSRLRNDLEE
jgi:dCTP deaminase